MDYLILPIKTETLLWLLPVVFMIHDFEEIIMMKPWLTRNRANLQKKLPLKAFQQTEKHGSMSVPAFALAVAEEFVVLSAVTFAAVEWELYNLWAGFLIGFFIHLLLHIGQFIAFRKYVPVILTSIPAAIYCVVAVNDLNFAHPFAWNQVAVWTLIALAFIVINLIFALKVARKFDAWLNEYYSEYNLN